MSTRRIGVCARARRRRLSASAPVGLRSGLGLHPVQQRAHRDPLGDRRRRLTAASGAERTGLRLTVAPMPRPRPRRRRPPDGSLPDITPLEPVDVDEPPTPSPDLRSVRLVPRPGAERDDDVPPGTLATGEPAPPSHPRQRSIDDARTGEAARRARLPPGPPGPRTGDRRDPTGRAPRRRGRGTRREAAPRAAWWPKSARTRPTRSSTALAADAGRDRRRAEARLRDARRGPPPRPRARVAAPDSVEPTRQQEHREPMSPQDGIHHRREPRHRQVVRGVPRPRGLRRRDLGAHGPRRRGARALVDAEEVEHDAAARQPRGDGRARRGRGPRGVHGAGRPARRRVARCRRRARARALGRARRRRAQRPLHRPRATWTGSSTRRSSCSRSRSGATSSRR